VVHKRRAAAYLVRDDAASEVGGMHRVRVGLIGLAWVFLLVAAATVVLRAVDDRAANSAQTNIAEVPTDPLADLGVAPGNPAVEDSAPGNTAGR
jgi:hypothetical protein